MTAPVFSHVMRTLLRFLLLLPVALCAEVMSFKSDFPDPQLRGRWFEVFQSDYPVACRLRSAIYLKQAEIDEHVRSCPPNSGRWREEIERWNQLRKENWELMQQLRAIVDKLNR
jgi:hypothetical protein